MKKEYIRPELNVLSLVVEDNTNSLGLVPIDRNDDDRFSIGDLLGDLFG